MISIVSIIESMDILGYKKHADEKPLMNNMYLISKDGTFKPESIAETYCSVEIEGALCTKSSSFNAEMVAEFLWWSKFGNIHKFDYSRKTLFPKLEGTIKLYDKDEFPVVNNQEYIYGPVDFTQRLEIRKAYQSSLKTGVLAF